MSVLVIVDALFNAESEGAAALTQTMKERLPFTRTYEGCEEIYLYVDQDDPNHLVLVEQWTTREHYEKYRAWAMEQPGTESLFPLLAREMTTIYLNKVEA